MNTQKKKSQKKPRVKKRNRRSLDPLADLNPRLNLKTRYELYDADYVDQLTPKELQWLNKFNKEWIGASMDPSPNKNLHRNKKLRKDCYDRNNSRNRDILTRAKASHQLADYEELDTEYHADNYEDFIIDQLDKNDAQNAIDWLAESLDKESDNLEAAMINESDTSKASRKKV